MSHWSIDNHNFVLQYSGGGRVAAELNSPICFWATVELWAEILHHFGRIFVGQSYGRPIISNE